MHGCMIVYEQSTDIQFPLLMSSSSSIQNTLSPPDPHRSRGASARRNPSAVSLISQAFPTNPAPSFLLLRSTASGRAPPWSAAAGVARACVLYALSSARKTSSSS